MKTRIAVLGFGKEINSFIRKMHKLINIVVYVVPDKYISEAIETINFCEKENILIKHSHLDLIDLEIDFAFMISYSPLIEESYLKKIKFINMHGALIPEYRGLHGGTWAIINGEKHHGYSIHEVDEGIDSGPVYHQGKIESSLEDTVISIRKKILEKFESEIEQVFRNIINSKISPIHQEEINAKYVCRRKPEDGKIEWNDNALNIHNLVRALTPPYTPGAFTFWKGEPIYIASSEYIEYPPYISTPGQVVAKYPKRGVLVKCKDRPLLIKDIIYEGIEMNAYNLFKTVGARLG
jgi:methionyl-tRNA formyltransferase